MNPKENHPWRKYTKPEALAVEFGPTGKEGPADGHKKEIARIRRARTRLTPAQRLALKIREGLD